MKKIVIAVTLSFIVSVVFPPKIGPFSVGENPVNLT